MNVLRELLGVTVAGIILTALVATFGQVGIAGFVILALASGALSTLIVKRK